MTVVSLYVSVNWVKSMCSGHIYHNFSCCDDLSKLGKEYLNSLKCEVCTFFSIKLRKFWHTARLSRTNRHKVIKSENSPVFWPTLYIAVQVATPLLETHMPHGITQCYMPPGRGDIPALTPAEAGTRLSDSGGMQGWVDLVLTEMCACTEVRICHARLWMLQIALLHWNLRLLF